MTEFRVVQCFDGKLSVYFNLRQKETSVSGKIIGAIEYRRGKSNKLKFTKYANQQYISLNIENIIRYYIFSNLEK